MFVRPAYTIADFERVRSLIASGMKDPAVSVVTGIPRATVRRWRLREHPPAGAVRAVALRQWTVDDPRSYCYLLGVYLGDGTVSHRPPSYWHLRVVNDRRYGSISAEILDAMFAVFPNGSVRRYQSWLGDSDILHVAHPAVGRAFPQHGPGRKHDREIALAEWQLRLTRFAPEALIRGLIHSDGCRCVNSFRTRLPSGRLATYSYARYFFSNRSADIRSIFREHCELLGVRVTQSNSRNLSISHRSSVEILDRIVGPKR